MTHTIESIREFPAPVFLGIVMLLALSVTLAYFSYFLLDESPQKKDKGKKRILDLLHNQLGSNTTFSLEYLRHVKSVVERQLSVTYNMVDLLEDYIVYVSELDTSKEQLDREQIFKTVQTFIETETQEQPFESLPPEERRLFHALAEAIEKPNEVAIQFNLRELCSVISARQNAYRRALTQNRWSVPLAVIGLILTLVFGLTSIFAGLKAPKIEQLVKNAAEAHLAKGDDEGAPTKTGSQQGAQRDAEDRARQPRR